MVNFHFGNEYQSIN